MTQIQKIEQNKLHHTSTPELRAELARAITITSQSLAYLAAIWQELEVRGEDLSSLRFGLSNYLPLIAQNKLSAELVVKYAGQKTLLQAISQLPIEIQNEINANDVVDLAILDGDHPRVEKTHLAELPVPAIYRVFSPEGIRSPSDQIKMIVKPKKMTSRKPRRTSNLKIEDGDLIVGKTWSVRLTRLTEILSEHYGIDLSHLDKIDQ